MSLLLALGGGDALATGAPPPPVTPSVGAGSATGGANATAAGVTAGASVAAGAATGTAAATGAGVTATATVAAGSAVGTGGDGTATGGGVGVTGGAGPGSATGTGTATGAGVTITPTAAPGAGSGNAVTAGAGITVTGGAAAGSARGTTGVPHDGFDEAFSTEVIEDDGDQAALFAADLIEDEDDLAGFFDVTQFAEAATWTPKAGGAAIACTIIFDDGEDTSSVGLVGIAESNRRIWVRRSEIANPRAGTFAIASDTDGPFRVTEATLDVTRQIWICKLNPDA